MEEIVSMVKARAGVAVDGLSDERSYDCGSAGSG
jgi:hypothetical protein